MNCLRREPARPDRTQLKIVTTIVILVFNYNSTRVQFQYVTLEFLDRLTFIHSFIDDLHGVEYEFPTSCAIAILSTCELRVTGSEVYAISIYHRYRDGGAG